MIGMQFGTAEHDCFTCTTGIKVKRGNVEDFFLLKDDRKRDSSCTD